MLSEAGDGDSESSTCTFEGLLRNEAEINKNRWLIFHPVLEYTKSVMFSKFAAKFSMGVCKLFGKAKSRSNLLFFLNFSTSPNKTILLEYSTVLEYTHEFCVGFQKSSECLGS